MAVGFGTEKLPGRESDAEIVNSAPANKTAISTLSHQSAVSINPDSIYFKYPLAWFAASVAEVATYPLDLTKTRLQVQGELQALNNGSSNQTKRGMMKTAIGIATEEGPFKLWQGMSVAIYRHAVYSGVRMGAYEQFRHLLGRDADGRFPLWKAIVASLGAGGLGQFLASPADLIKVQIQMEGRRKLEGKPPRVRGSWHAFTKILSEGGIPGLWKGWVPNVQRAALVNMGDLATYDTCKQLILGNTRLKDNYVTHTLASVASGAMAAILGTPADVVKTRIMNQPTDSKGRGLLYKSSMDCVMKTVRSEGFWALYKGFLPIWIRMAPWSLTFWLTHEEIRKLAGASSF